MLLTLTALVLLTLFLAFTNGANDVTSALVALASFYALPVSSTHVSSGSILGIGLAKGGCDVRWKTLYEVLLAWLVTLPVAAMIGALLFRVSLFVDRPCSPARARDESFWPRIMSGDLRRSVRREGDNFYSLTTSNDQLT